MSDMTTARATFLKSSRTGVHAVEAYKPAMWALLKGYVTLKVGMGGGNRMHRITPAGEAALLRAGMV